MNGEVLTLHFPTLPPKATAQQKGAFVRGGRAHFYTKAKVRRESQNMVALVLSKLPKDWEPLAGPLSLRVKLVYPYRKSEKKSLVKAGVEIPHDRRPDYGNLLKGLEDALTVAGVWQDDSQLCKYHDPMGKFWGPRPYWEVGVSRVAVAPENRECRLPGQGQAVLAFDGPDGIGVAERV